MIRLEVRVEAMGRTAPWRLGPLKGEVARARTAFRDRTLAARGAADAALGLADALALYIRSGPAMTVDSAQLVLPLSAPLAARG